MKKTLLLIMSLIAMNTYSQHSDENKSISVLRQFIYYHNIMKGENRISAKKDAEIIWKDLFNKNIKISYSSKRKLKNNCTIDEIINELPQGIIFKKQNMKISRGEITYIDISQNLKFILKMNKSKEYDHDKRDSRITLKISTMKVIKLK